MIYKFNVDGFEFLCKYYDMKSTSTPPQGQGPVEKKINIPSYEEVIACKGKTLLAIDQGLEYGISLTRQKFFDLHGPKDEDGKRRVDRSLAPHLVRYWAKEFLGNNGYSVSERNYKINDIPQNGLYLIDGNFHFRVLKADEGRLPVPGNSKVKQDFYQQRFHQGALAFPDQESLASTIQPVGFVVLWDTDLGYTIMHKLILACPKSGDVSRASVGVHWREFIEHPVLSIEATDEQSRLDIQETNLPIYPEQEDEEQERKRRGTGTEGVE